MKEKEILETEWINNGEKCFAYAIEEMAELTKAICKYMEGRGLLGDVARECADVIITVGVLSYAKPTIFKEKKKRGLLALSKGK